MPTDFKKTEKSLYQPGTAPSIINVPAMTFIAVDGKGDPNASSEYVAAIELLYGLSYAIKMANKALLDYVVLPLEGLWDQVDGSSYSGDKSSFVWTMMIRQPEFVSADIFTSAGNVLARKKPALNIEAARLLSYHEGLCVQIMHIGSYDNEPESVNKMEQFIMEQGHVSDLSASRRHHEIYLSDPRRVAAAKLRTIIRHPIRKSGS